VHEFLNRISARFGAEDEQAQLDLVARHIQHALLDVSLPVMPGLDIGVHAEPSRLVGGDYIDIFAREEQSLVFGLGDASGKSLGAALNAMMLRYLIRGLVRVLGAERLEAIVTHANGVVTEELTEGEFITFLLGRVNLKTGILSIVNAGHEPPLVLRAGSSVVETMDIHDIVLGIGPETNYVREDAPFSVGDTVVFYTDGLTEATNDRGELYTRERLIQALLDERAKAAQDLADVLFLGIKTFSASQLRDDATILVLRRLAETSG
jgi:sigma-B regulation protein RsbU (phosphoserine phosphatase)